MVPALKFSLQSAIALHVCCLFNNNTYPISSVLDDEDAKNKWRYYRERYVKLRRAMMSKDDPTKAAEENRWELYDLLKFLDPHILMKHAPNNSFISEKQDMEYVDFNNYQYSVNHVYDVDDDMDDDNSNANVLANGSVASASHLDMSCYNGGGDANAEEVIVHPTYNRTHEAVEEDDVETAFGRYVAAEMKQMSAKRKRECKQMFFNFVLADE